MASLNMMPFLFTQKLPNTPKKLPVTLIQKSRKKESYYITRM